MQGDHVQVPYSVRSLLSSLLAVFAIILGQNEKLGKKNQELNDLKKGISLGKMQHEGELQKLRDALEAVNIGRINDADLKRQIAQVDELIKNNQGSIFTGYNFYGLGEDFKKKE